MHSPGSLLTLILVAGGTLTSALPASTIEAELQSRTPTLSVRQGGNGRTVLVGQYPEAAVTCPAAPPGQAPPRDYPKFPYSVNQIKSAFLTGAKLAAEGKQIGDRKYPHGFGNGEQIPFPCGTNKMEFPIQMDGKPYAGDGVTTTPDRVVFEYNDKDDKQFKVKFCGVMRHDPAGFVACPT